jgi:hypothetical protein
MFIEETSPYSYGNYVRKVEMGGTWGTWEVHFLLKTSREETTWET